MRISKYRAWHKQEKRMYIVTEMEWCNNSLSLPVCRLTLLSTDELGTVRNVYGESVNNYELMVYVMQDCNDKELHEDDLVQLPDTNKRGIVKWNTSKPEFYVYGSAGADYSLSSDWEVIGNIWE